MSDVPFANGAPNLSVDLPCMIELAARHGVPIAGKDFKTGQTLMKTLLAPGFKARMLGLRGWYSTNILGNRDGEVLDDPENSRPRRSRTGRAGAILQPDSYPDLYGNIDHVVRINYYPPRGDNKEGWDNIDIFGWMGYPMQIKVDFLCRDSFWPHRSSWTWRFLGPGPPGRPIGCAGWLSFYLKAPQAATEAGPNTTCSSSRPSSRTPSGSGWARSPSPTPRPADRPQPRLRRERGRGAATSVSAGVVVSTGTKARSGSGAPPSTRP
ncbi:MAG: hypothetical protein Ct9H300mP31_16460 [Acidimicrobiaceae bacterium]|nr:MAG: hypothetical protein Ct9H300mP31_16460 [Acidimicrobiaceae bacterium]